MSVINKGKKSWLNQNLELLLQDTGNWIACNHKRGLISYDKDLDGLISQAEAITKKFTVWHVNKHFGEPGAFGRVHTYSKQTLFEMILNNVIISPAPRPSATLLA